MAGPTGSGDVSRLMELRSALGSKNPAVRRAAMLKVEAGWGMEQAVAEALGDPDPEVRRASVRVLGRIDGPYGTQALIRASGGDLSPAVRRDAVTALGRILAEWTGPGATGDI